MRNTKKWLVLLLTVVMLVNTLGVTAMATENESPIALALATEAGSGTTTQVQILATKAQTVADGKLVLTYDAEALAYIDAEPGAAWGEDQVTLSVNALEGKVILAFANAAAASEGVLFTLRFKVSADAAVAIDGSSYITGVNADLAQQINTCPSARFTDLGTVNPEAHDAVDFMAANGYMTGMSQTSFGPYVELNRAMMVTMLYRMAGSPETTGDHPFVDVPDGTFYTQSVIWALENDVTTGIDDTHFAPSKPLTRQELVTFLYRFAGVMGYDRTATTELSGYTDTDLIRPYAVDAFKWAVAEGIIRGTSETTLDPTANTVRFQVALMIYRLLSQQN